MRHGILLARWELGDLLARLLQHKNGPYGHAPLLSHICDSTGCDARMEA
jgi:hypothetical protein